MTSYHTSGKKRKSQLEEVAPVSLTVPEEVLSYLSAIQWDAKAGLLGLAYSTGLATLQAMMQAEVQKLVGPRGHHNSQRTAYRHGVERGCVTFGGRKVNVTKPRVRSMTGKELTLRTYEQFKKEDALETAAMERLLYGLSTRTYAKGLEIVGEPRGIARNSISRRLIKGTRKALEELLTRRLDDRRYVALFIDGHGLGEHTVITVMGLDSEGRKHVLGLREGATENATVCKALLAELVERGLDSSRGLLAVIDGSKALCAAVKAVFGPQALVQRCQVHKMRNVLDHLPNNMQSNVKQQITQAYLQTDAPRAKRLLENLARNLEHDYPSAAASLREGLEETLTVMRLQIPGLLKRTLKSTNPIESIFDVTARYTRNVKRWSNGDMALRWMAAALREAEKQFRRVKGYQEIPALISALAGFIAGEPVLLSLEETA